MQQQFAFLRRAAYLIWQASGYWTLIWIAVSLVQGILPALSVYLTKSAVDLVATSIGGSISRGEVISILLVAGALGATMLGQRILRSIGEWVNLAQNHFVQDYVKRLIHEKASKVDYGFFESPAYFDQFYQANTQASSRTLSLLRSAAGILQSAVTFLSIGAILMQYSVWLPALLLVSSLPALVLLLRHNHKHHAWWKEIIAEKRWANYLDAVLTSQAAAAEIRINDLGEFFGSRHRTIRERLRQQELGLAARRSLSRIAANVLAFVVMAGAMCWILWRALSGAATLGDLALFYQSFNQGQSLAGTLLSSLADIHGNTLFLEQVFEYLDRPNLIEDPIDPAAFPTPICSGIEFRDVQFTYPGRDRPALEQFDLQIPAGKTVAIVGENGAGKSTILKLLCRLYDPAEGCVTIDGNDLRHLSQRELRRHIAVMFQFPVKYHLSVADNILIGDLPSAHGMEEVEEAARCAGAHEFITRLPKSYDTMLGRSFEDAAELSGGEWQRLALARAFLRPAQILVLDEPTSFMDSWAESDWLKRFRRMAQGRTAVIVTHRFTTAMQADVIHVMDHGRIVESGRHADLLELDGKYARSWRQQQREFDELAVPHGAPFVEGAGRM